MSAHPPTLGVTLVLQAATFAAHKHRAQRRKGQSAPPYINHPLQVAELLARVGGVTDPALLCAALLHDTLEDTATTHAELVERFGAEIADLVAEVSDDRSLPGRERKRLQVERTPHKSPRARLLKLADKICNIRDIVLDPPRGWDTARRRAYLAWCERVIAGARGLNAPLEQRFDDWLARAYLHLDPDTPPRDDEP